MNYVLNWIDQAKGIDIVSLYMSAVMLIYLVFDKLGRFISEEKTTEGFE